MKDAITPSFGRSTMRIFDLSLGEMLWARRTLFMAALGVFYGTSLIADEVEDKTITYLFTRPIPRRSIVMGKYLAYVVCTTSVVLPSVMIAFLLMVPLAEMAAAFGK